jgi:hypothetical protein
MSATPPPTIEIEEAPATDTPPDDAAPDPPPPTPAAEETAEPGKSGASLEETVC